MVGRKKTEEGDSSCAAWCCGGKKDFIEGSQKCCRRQTEFCKAISSTESWLPEGLLTELEVTAEVVRPLNKRVAQVIGFQKISRVGTVVHSVELVMALATTACRQVFHVLRPFSGAALGWMVERTAKARFELRGKEKERQGLRVALVTKACQRLPMITNDYQ